MEDVKAEGGGKALIPEGRNVSQRKKEQQAGVEFGKKRQVRDRQGKFNIKNLGIIV